MLMITGPNMGGKSTYMRQTALIVLLAKMGSWVPAASATLGPIDRIFTRIGASDDLASGQSTFMVEMTEAATIVHQAGPQSLVLLDEVGRGTSTFDGLSLAWAIARHLATKSRALTLFATHYFELTQLAQDIPMITNIHLQAVESKGHIAFLHSIAQGPASRSYGLQVAKLAGMPSTLIKQAQAVLSRLEARSQQSDPDQLTLFNPALSNETDEFDQEHDLEDTVSSTTPETGAHPALLALQELDPDALTPREALQTLYSIKKLLHDPAG